VAVTVRDNGQGIVPEMLDRIFDMFAQVDRKHTHTGGGLGIGLTLVRRLVEMHAGRVEARSDGAGTGSTFVVRLPLATARAREHPAPAPDARSEAPARRLRVLVADDNVDAASSLAMMLDLLGHETRVAHNGRKALAVAGEFRPDAMVLDIAMPQLGGHDVARTIRREPWGGDVLLIAASGWGQDGDKQKSEDAGFDHHLVKPVEIDLLDRLLRDT
jgi:CheY-like chemotaxis protein